MAVMMGAEKGVKTLSEREWQRDLWVYAAPGPPWATVAMTGAEKGAKTQT